MLEQPSLLLKPWLHSGEAGGWARRIVDPTTERSLGLAAWDDLNITRLFFWLGRRKVRVLESEDESLLMTLHRPWGISRVWEVLDSEERTVGRLCRDALYDGYGSLLATMTVSADGADWEWHGADGLVLGSWQEIPGQGRYFRFGAALDENPFVRMALLAGTLALPPWPGDLSLVARPMV